MPSIFGAVAATPASFGVRFCDESTILVDIRFTFLSLLPLLSQGYPKRCVAAKRKQAIENAAKTGTEAEHLKETRWYDGSAVIVQLEVSKKVPTTLDPSSSRLFGPTEARVFQVPFKDPEFPEFGSNDVKPRQLVNAAAAPPTSVFGRLLLKLTRLDSASHVLFWSDSLGTNNSTKAGKDDGFLELARVSRVVLPRLKLELSLHRLPSGESRFECLGGFWICEVGYLLLHKGNFWIAQTQQQNLEVTPLFLFGCSLALRLKTKRNQACAR
jgi:hypothetical protein